MPFATSVGRRAATQADVVGTPETIHLARRHIQLKTYHALARKRRRQIPGQSILEDYAVAGEVRNLNADADVDFSSGNLTR